MPVVIEDNDLRLHTHNADHSATLNLVHRHYTVIIHKFTRGITLTNRGEVIKEEEEKVRVRFG